MSNQNTGNAALYHVARELSRLGWHVMPTIRNARGADLFAVSDRQLRVLPIQSKGLAKPNSVPLGLSLERLCSPWWAITINALDANPISYILTLDEVKAAAARRVNVGGTASFWLQEKAYKVTEYQEAWYRLGVPSDDLLE